MNHPFGVLRVRNFRLHFAGQVVSNVGTWFQSIALALVILELTGSGRALGLISALQFLPALLLGPYAGTLVDRLRPHALLAVTAGLSAACAATLATFAALDHVSAPLLYALSLALGCVQAFERPSAQAFLYELAGPDELPRAIALHSVTQSSARMIGPALGGLAYALLGAAACFAINALSFLAVIVALSCMNPAELRVRAPAAPDERGGLLQGVRYALDRPELRAPLLAAIFVGCLAWNFMTTITAMVRFELGGDAGALGSAHALNAAGAVLGSLLVASLTRPAARTLLAATCFALALALGVNAAAPSLSFFLCFAPVFGLALGAYQTTLLTSVQRAAAPAMQGRVAGLLTLGTVGAIPIASLIAGALIDAWSARAAIALGAGACALAATSLALTRRTPRAHDEPRQPDQPAAAGGEAAQAPSGARARG